MAKTIVLAVLDSLRYDIFFDYLSADGSPFIKQFVNSGVNFTGATATAPWSLPSHASMFTGKYPREHGALRSNTRIRSDTPTLTDRLNDRGFVTACFTSNEFIRPDFGFNGWDRCPDHYGHARFPDAHSPLSDETGINKLLDALGQVVDSEKPHKSFLNAVYAQAKRSPPLLDDHGKIMTRDMVQWLDRLPNQDDLFLFCNYMETHDYHRQISSIRKRLWNVAHKKDLDAIQSILRSVEMSPHDPLMSKGEIELFKTLMMDELRYVDRLLDRLYQALEEQGRADDCLFILCADHGEGAGERGFVYHALGGITEPIVRVPLVVSSPNTMEKEIRERVSLAWVYSTVLDFADSQTGPNLVDPSTYPNIVGTENTNHVIDIVDSTDAIDEYYLKPRLGVYQTGDPERKYVRIGDEYSTRAIEANGLTEDDIEENGKQFLRQFEREHESVDKQRFSLNESTKSRLQDMGYI